MKRFRCADAGVVCGAEVEGETEQEVPLWSAKDGRAGTAKEPEPGR